MSRLKIEHGASRINLVLLKTNIEDAISQDIDLMAAWSDNERRYIVNELLRFALTQEEDFQKYKASVAAAPTKALSSMKPAASPVKTTTEMNFKSDSPAAAHA